MKADAINFKQAFELLAESVSSAVPTGKEKPVEKETVGARATAKTELEYLEKAADYYHKSLLKNEKAIAYLRERGITPEAIRVFRVGFADGSLKDKISADGKANLESLGLLNERGNETLFGSVVFPLLDAGTNQTVGLYARHIEKKQHLYLSGKRRGLFNPAGAKEAGEIVLTESVIDALALWSIGIRNVSCSYGVNGLTDEISAHLSESRIKKVTLMLDADDTGREAAPKFTEKLSAIGIESRVIELPAKDASEFVASGGTLEEVQSLLSEVQSQSEIETVAAEMETLADGTRQITFAGREYRVRGLTSVGLEKL
jgi:DNA primase